MRTPNKRLHLRLSIGGRNAPRPLAEEHNRGRSGYVVVNHSRDGLPSATDLPALYTHEAAAQTARGSIIRGIQARQVIATEFCALANALGRADDAAVLGGELISGARFEVVAVSAVLPADSPLLLAQLQVQELIAANRRKDEFLALLSHELRSPLAAMGYAVGLLRRHTVDSGPQQPLQALIERQVLRMSQLVEEVLDVSRITNGLLHLHRERVDLRQAVINAVETLHSDIKGRNQHLSTVLPEAPVWILGDERRLEQVFVNLIANASRYTDNGGELVASMYIEGGEAVIRIRDSGIGIAPDLLVGIFELFRQANGADPRSKAGLGVGLALVRQLVELHEGNVTAASEGIGRGSEFKVCLPLQLNWARSADEMSVGEDSRRLSRN